MKVSSVTLTSRTREGVIREAIESVVDWVDEVLVLLIDDTSDPLRVGPTGDDRTLEVAEEAAKGKYRMAKVPWGLDWAGMRNFAIEEATRGGADWAAILDTDERYQLRGFDIREMLEKSGMDNIEAYRAGNGANQIRFIKLPTESRYHYNIHEDFRSPDGVKRAMLKDIKILELPKDDLEAYNRGQIDRMEAQLAEEPWNPRWQYYVADMRAKLKDYDIAVPLFEELWKKQPCAWFGWKWVTNMAMMGKPDEALKKACELMYHHPGHAEIPMAAGLCCLDMHRWEDAIHWGRMASSITWVGLKAEDIPVTYGKELKAYYDGPWWVIDQACTALCSEDQRIKEQMEKTRIAREEVWG